MKTPKLIAKVSVKSLLNPTLLAGLGVVALATYVRCLGYSGRSLWVDEAWRANILLAPGQIMNFFLGTDLYGAITSPLYIMLNRIVTFFYCNEEMLRLSSLLPSLAAVYFAYRTIYLISKNWILALGCSLIFALNIHLVSYAKELKPYSFEVFLFVFTIYKTFIFLEKENWSQKHFWILSVTLVGGLLGAPVMVYLWPAVILSVLYKSYERKSWNQIFQCVGLGFFLGVTSLILYFLAWSKASDSQNLLAYWRDGFHQPRQTYFQFLSESTQGLFQQSFETHLNIFSYSGKLKKAFGLFWLGLLAAAIRICIRNKKIPFLILLLTPLVIVLALNYLGKWPYGPLRVNLFLFPIFIYLSSLVGISQRKWVASALGSFFVFSFGLAAIPLSTSYYSEIGPSIEDSRDTIEKLQKSITENGTCAEDRPTIVLENSAISHSHNFYLTFHDEFKQARPWFDRCVKFDHMFEAYSDPIKSAEVIAHYAAVPGGQPLWLIYSHLNPKEVSQLINLAEKYGSISQHTEFRNAGLFLLTPTQK